MMNDNATHDESFIPATSLPCPDWCGMRTGHGFDSATDDGILLRYHEAEISRFEYRDRYAGRPEEQAVHVVAEERAQSNDGPVTDSSAPWIDAPECLGLDADSASALLDALTTARDLYLRITSGGAA